jgi:hypothetical protein
MGEPFFFHRYATGIGWYGRNVLTRPIVRESRSPEAGRTTEHKETTLPGGKTHATPRRGLALLSAVLVCVVLAPPLAAADVSPADLNAAVRSLGFLSSLQSRSSIVIGVVYNGADPASKAQAARAAAELVRLAGPRSATITAFVVAAQDLGSQHYDAIYLMGLPAETSRAVSDFVRRQGVVSVSYDPACLEMQTCVLLVQARTSMSVVLDTALAKAAGAKFSTVFTMLVKRK